jgi:hypothetical protein
LKLGHSVVPCHNPSTGPDRHSESHSWKSLLMLGFGLLEWVLNFSIRVIIEC